MYTIIFSEGDTWKEVKETDRQNFLEESPAYNRFNEAVMLALNSCHPVSICLTYSGGKILREYKQTVSL